MPEEALGEAEPDWSDANREEELSRLMSSGLIKSWSIEEIQQIVNEYRSAIVMENGVFRIKEEVYSAEQKEKERTPARPTEEKLKEIAEKVVRHGQREEKPSGALSGGAAEAEGLGLSGIGDLIRDEGEMDLLKMVSESREGEVEETLPVERENANPIRLKKNGFDYDEFLSSHPRSFTHTTQMKSLVEISRRVSAVSAGLFLKKAQGYVPDLTIGFSEKSNKLLTFKVTDPIHALLLAHRKAVAVNWNLSEIRTLKEKLDADDLRYMKRILMLPASFRGQEAYLLLAFATEIDIAMDVMLSRLMVQ